MTKRLLIFALASGPLALAACERAPKGSPPTETPSSAPTPTELVTPSIIRPEVLPEPTETLLEPLELTVPFAEGGTALGEAAERALAKSAQRRDRRRRRRCGSSARAPRPSRCGCRCGANRTG